MIRSIIIEDEVRSSDLLSKMLLEYCTDIQVVGSAKNVTSGVELIQSLKPDLVFLDIEIKGGTGFDILQEVTEIPFALIFITGYDHYAIKAIKYAAIDYLLKPINLQELKNAIQRIQSEKKLLYNRIAIFLDRVKGNDSTKLIIHDSKNYSVIDFSDIIFLQAEGTYVKFFLSNHKIKISTYHLLYFEKLLPTELFFRIHKSYIINLKKINSYKSLGRTGEVTLIENHQIPIAARRKSNFIKIFKNQIK